MITYVKVFAVSFTFNMFYVKIFALFFTLNKSYVKRIIISLYNFTNRLYSFKMIICLRAMLNKNMCKSRIKIKIAVS